MLSSCTRFNRIQTHHTLVTSERIQFLKRIFAHCSFSTTEKQDLIPEPTWSLSELELTSKAEPVSMQELERLARKSLLDVSKLKDTDALRRDLSNMLHCLEQVRDTNLPDSLSDEQVYDVPRGVTAAPLRSASNDAYKEEEAEEAKHVWETLLKPKTKQRGAHSYFSVVTKREAVRK